MSKSGTDGRIDRAVEHQHIDGFGFCQGFQRAAVMRGMFGLPPRHQREVLDLLLHPRSGAGLSILRLCVGSASDDTYDRSRSIQPSDPGGPLAPPRYEWDGDDAGQLWLAKEAYGYGVRRFYANAWSAPAYMKANGAESGGAWLAAGWSRAYAEYLLQYVRFYAAEGIAITDLGFVNEPELALDYASMQATPAQVVEFAKVLGEAVAAAEFRLTVACCDSVGWPQQAAYTAAISADAEADAIVGLHTAHQYGLAADDGTIAEGSGRADHRLATDRPVWMSEWLPEVKGGGEWSEFWDDGGPSSGFALAENIHDALTAGSVNAYLFWFGASIGATRALIQLDGPDYRVSKRLWAVAAYSRFLQPGSRRIAATVADAGVKVTAFRTATGDIVVELLNTHGYELSVRLAGGPDGEPVAYRTDEAHSLAVVPAATRDGEHLDVVLAARSLATVVTARPTS